MLKSRSVHHSGCVTFSQPILQSRRLVFSLLSRRSIHGTTSKAHTVLQNSNLSSGLQSQSKTSSYPTWIKECHLQRISQTISERFPPHHALFRIQFPRGFFLGHLVEQQKFKIGTIQGHLTKARREGSFHRHSCLE